MKSDFGAILGWPLYPKIEAVKKVEAEQAHH